MRAIVAKELFKVVVEEAHREVAGAEEDHHRAAVEEEDQHVEIVGEEEDVQYKLIKPKQSQLKRKRKSRKIRVLKLKMVFHSTLPSKMAQISMNLKN